MDLIRKVEEAIRRGRLIRPGMRVVVACSGGADSVALLLLLDALRQPLGLRLFACHLNHQLRGAESDADERFVRELAAHLGLECVVERTDVGGDARERRLNLEEAGRQARFEFFTALCRSGKADAVAVAHTLDDQAETLLARLVRGTGLAGLTGIHPVIELEPGRLVRPLLGVRRADLRAFLQERGQGWRDDPSNLDPVRLRNQIRLLLPKLEELNPAAIEHLAGLASRAGAEESFWNLLVEERLRTLARCEGTEWRIPARQLLEPLGDLYSEMGVAERTVEAAQRAVARRLVRRLVEAVRGSARRLTAEHIEQVLRLAEAGRSGDNVSLPGAEVERTFDELVVRARRGAARRASSSYAYEVPVPGAIDVPAAHQRLQFKLVAAGSRLEGYNGTRIAVLDAEAALGAGRERAPGVTVRNWRPGDRYQPVGSAQPKKLKELFQRARVPAAARVTHPVVECGGEIIWASGFGVAANCAVGEGTQGWLVILQEPLEEKSA